jgi:hypothetical protein
LSFVFIEKNRENPRLKSWDELAAQSCERK